MSKARQCIIKAAALRVQADKLEKVAVLVDQDVDGGSRPMSTAAKVGLGLGAGALGLAAGGALGFGTGGALGLAKGGALGLAKGRELGLRWRDFRRASDLKDLRSTALRAAVLSGGITGVGSLLAGAHPVVAGLRALSRGIEAGRFGHELVSLSNNIKDYIRLSRAGLM